jgi:hypothetical protein
MLDFELLRAFVAVADCGGFHRAAERLNLTQSTVSQQIKRLELETKRPLSAILILIFLSVAGLCHLFGGTMGGVRAGQRSRRYWWRLGEGESEQQVVP